MKKKFVNQRFAGKNKGYAETIQKIKKAGHCPFCPENFIYHEKPIIKRSGTWFITESSHPYKNSKYHFLIIGMKHKESILDLEISDFKSIRMLARYVIKKYGIRGGGLMLRFGDTNYTGATVAHLHFHLISPNFKKRKSVSVNFPIG